MLAGIDTPKIKELFKDAETLDSLEDLFKNYEKLETFKSGRQHIFKGFYNGLFYVEWNNYTRPENP